MIERNFLDEAIRILKGESLLLPQVEHLQALNESRVFWRTSALGHQSKLPRAPQLPQAERDLARAS